MIQAKFSLREDNLQFINQYNQYGYKDKSAMVREALSQLKHELEIQALRESADLYAEIYEEDDDMKDLTDAALSGWPE